MDVGAPMREPTSDLVVHWDRYVGQAFGHRNRAPIVFIDLIDWRRVHVTMIVTFKQCQRHWAAVRANQNIAGRWQ